jgi:hypothetical protein
MPLNSKTLAEAFTFGRSSTATYIGPDGLIKSAAANEPRFTYDPVTGENLGLMIEREATNLLTFSGSVGVGGGWSSQEITIGAGTTLAPDGSTSVSELIPSTTNGEHYVQHSLPLTESHYGSQFYVKKAAGSGIIAFVIVAVGTPVDVTAIYINIDSLTTLTGAGLTVLEASAVDVGNGWVKCTIRYYLSGGASSHATRIHPLSAYGSTVVAGDGINGVYIWGAQTEKSVASTSYIPTTTSEVTRAKDTLVNLFPFDFYNQAEGTFYIELGYFAGEGSARLFQVDDGVTTSESMLLYVAPNVNGSFDALWEQYSGGGSFATFVGNFSNGGVLKIAVTYNLSSASVKTAAAGSLRGATAGLTLPNTISNLNVGTERNGAQLGGTIKDFRYYPRELTDAELIAITA